MANSIPQRSITISVNGTDANATVSYTYLSPISGLSYAHAPTCDLSCTQPTYCLYLLDFAATQNGWTIVNTTPNQESGTLSQTTGPNNLSVMTFNPFTSASTYRFYINYMNMATGAKISFDPQEGNIPPV